MREVLYKGERGEVDLHKLRLLGDNLSTIVRIGQISSGSSVRYVDEIKRGKSTVKTIEEMAKSTKKCDVWIAGTIVAANATKDSWYYAACKKCKKLVHQNDDNQYECKECHYIDDRAILS
ncbi:hypothetical protein PIB30_021061 [Stylosanthes scabra]|uniref:Replication factor A C-terminal domain-containing protein n=1 Tax=Stylosanthes scabra TaxID=79078 RepID=A0ABU6W7B8_9FABA|nr:hypothetical protein [Stylosanthes scabra]